MPKKQRKALSQEQKEDAARLLALWNDYKRRTKRSQAKAAAEWGIGETQGILWQYTHARIPIGLPVALKFAKGLGCRVADISPTLAEQLPPDNGITAAAVGNDRNLLQLIGFYFGVDEERKAAILGRAQTLYNEQFPGKSHGNPYYGAPLPQEFAGSSGKKLDGLVKQLMNAIVESREQFRRKS